MCGVIGAIGSHAINTKFLNHRGPDDNGYLNNNIVSFAHTRLSILDLSQHGHQPTESEEVILTYNGEIYNYKQLATAETCDTVALLKWLSHSGSAFDPSLLDGMYAFGAYFKNTNELVLCRDYAGIKPLYIYIGEHLAFSSELKGFFGFEWFRSNPTTGADIQHELIQYGYLAAPKSVQYNGQALTLIPTIVDKVYVVPPGSKIIINLRTGGIYQQAFRPTNEGDTDLQQEIIAQSMADVEVGVQLSGGIDSSIVSYYYMQHARKTHGFYVSVPGDQNEDKWVKIAANEISKHGDFTLHKIDLTHENFLRAFRIATWHNDEPILRHPNACAIYLLCEYVKKNTNVKVLLTGEGADELFGGYSWHDGIDRPTYGNERSLFPGPNRHLALLDNKLTHPLEKQMRYDFKVYLPPILARQDRMSMAHSIESRVPFLSNRFMALPLPLIPGKRVLKAIATVMFGKEFANRPKCGFGMPPEWYTSTSIDHQQLSWIRCLPAPTNSFQHFCCASLALWSSYYFGDGYVH